MRNRDQQAAQDGNVGNLNPEKAYALIDAIRVAFEVGAFGLGANGNITRSSSMVTAITVEGFCSLLALIVAVHEIINVCTTQCFRRDEQNIEATNRSPTEYSTYLSFRMASIVTSFVGMSLIAADLGAETSTVKSIIGIAAISLGIFASRALSSSKQKPAGIVLQNDGPDIEMGLLDDQQPPPQPPMPQQARRAAIEPAAPARQNQFFQDQQAPVGRDPQAQAPAPTNAPPKKIRWVKRYKKPAAKTPQPATANDNNTRLANGLV